MCRRSSRADILVDTDMPLDGTVLKVCGHVCLYRYVFSRIMLTCALTSADSDMPEVVDVPE